jgi:hypothetical protein
MLVYLDGFSCLLLIVARVPPLWAGIPKLYLTNDWLFDLSLGWFHHLQFQRPHLPAPCEQLSDLILF